MGKFKLKTPVVFITFNRLDTVKTVFGQIKKAQPDKLYLISDGARRDKEGEADKVNAVRAYVEDNIDWECSVIRIYSDENLGCRARIASGLDEVFNREESAIIIEDDIFPHDTFFEYCQTLLEWYKDDLRIGMLTGCNLCPEYDTKESYIFSKIPEIWGWATWRRVWKMYRGELMQEELEQLKRSGYLKNYWGRWYGNTVFKGLKDVQLGRMSAWSYHFLYVLAANNQLCIAPGKNLISNIGFGRADATNTSGRGRYVFPEGELELPIKKRADCSIDYNYDSCYINNYHKENPVQFMYTFIVGHYLDWKKDRERSRNGGLL